MPSKMRPGVNRDDAQRRIENFTRWLDQKRGIKKLGLNVDQFLAIAQHYGIPTMLMDFTTSPRVAGFFASDGATEHGCTHGAIYMINSEEFKDVMETVHKVVDKEIQLEAIQLEIVRVEVDNLWRLNAQHGLFLFTNAQNFEWFFSLDKIVFAHDYRSSPIMSHDEIYPIDKSPLELDIEHYFYLEKKPSLEEIRELLINTFGISQQKVIDESIHQARADYLQSKAREAEGLKTLFGDLVEPHTSWAGWSELNTTKN